MLDTSTSPGRAWEHPRGDVDGDPADVAVGELDLAGVQPGSYFEPEGPDACGDVRGAPDGASRTVEGRYEPVTCGCDLPSTETTDALANEHVVPVEKLAPAAVSELGGEAGRVDDVGEEDSCEHAVR